MQNHLSIAGRLYAGVGVTAAIVVAAGALMFGLSRSAETSIRHQVLAGHAADALADAQSALWELRYGFPQFLVSDDAGKKKVTEAEPKLRARIEDSFKQFEASTPSTEQSQQLAELKAVFGKYMDARPKWFELQLAGKADEAKEWRAATTTPFGAATAKGFGASVDLQGKVTEAQSAQALASIQSQRLMIGGLLALALLATAGMGVWVVRSIRTPLAAASELARRVADGDLTKQAATVAGNDEIAQLTQSLNQMVARLSGMVGQVREAASSIQLASSEVASGNLDLSQRTEQTASNLQVSASSIEELSSTVKQTAESARTANQLASSASAVAQRGGEVVAQVVTTMDQINTSSKKIADIIGTIDGIAFQTNILALNAAVEAARAGEQGRGFAVVASEVRSLAGRSAEAAREIKSLIGASVENVESGSRLVRDAGATMTEIVASVQRVSDIIAEISAAANEQSTGIGLVNSSVNELDKMTQQNAALVEESSAAAESLKHQATQLGEVVARFRIDAAAGTVPTRAAATPAAYPAARPAASSQRTAPRPVAKAKVTAEQGEWASF